MGVREVADAALRSLVRTVLCVSRSVDLARLAERREVQERLPGFAVRLGYGLHYGWAVECAIGSDLKVDTSYISSHVNLATRLEEATKHYGVSILISGQTHGLLSPYIQSLCRLVDKVVVKGTIHPFELYTYDVPVSSSSSAISDFFATNPSITNPQFFAALTPSTTPEFKTRFAEAIDCYLGGPDGSEADWPKACAMLTWCLELKPKDGPCLAIIGDIERKAKSDGNCPSTWRGFRLLDTK
mmetsp:Transcript_2013/g.4551  ORF Transcript_2013/g.4551 Transcript_2013/m.4551 type:complete len:242 (+) Transcript_2013:3-728(+)